MELLIIIVLFAILAEVTFLAVRTTQWTPSRKQDTPVFVDTSVLIDGRIIAVAASGFISNELKIPRSVIGELQFLADHADTEKRARARHGLDVVSELQHMENLRISIFQDGSKAEEGVDERLLKLAKRYNGSICTIDYNLNKVAVVEGITVLNVNELTKSLRMAYLPGERMMLELTQKGQDAHQAIGHLGDGTMVVVEHASSLIGQAAEVEFIRSLQTAAGKMMFAKPVKDVRNSEPKKKQEQGRKPVSPTTQPVALSAETTPAEISNASTLPTPAVQQPRRQNVRQAAPKPQMAQSRRQPKTTQARRQRRPKNQEESLIELVNRQDQ